MSFGIVGAHRVGKTTLAERLSNETNMGLVEANVGGVFKEMGIDPAEPMPFSTRMLVQNTVLDRCEAAWSKEKKPFFTDRTPICMLGYTTADLAGHICLTDAEHQAYMDYRRRCFAATHRFFSHLFVVQPGIPLVDPGDKPTAAMSKSYIEHLNTIMIGLSHDVECHTPVSVMKRSTLDLDLRCDAVLEEILRSYKKHDTMMQGVRFH